MGTQGPGRKRHPNREKLSAEDHALNQIAREAEARLAAKRAARAEAREIRMKELERQQKEIYQIQKKYYGLDAKWGDIEQWMASDEDDMSVTSRSSLRTNGYEDELLGATQYRKSSRSSTGSGENLQSSRRPPRDEATSAYYSDLSLASAPLTSKALQQSVHNGSSRPSLLNCNSLPSRSQRGSLYDEGVTSGSRRSSSSRPPSEYSCYLGSGSRASSRASSARASPVSSEPTGPSTVRRGSTSGSLTSLSHLENVEERPDKDFAEKSGRPVSSLSAATLASLGGTSSRRGSGDTSISVDTEASIREIKEISELKEQIEDVEGKYMQGLKEMKDSLAEVEEKYKRSMVTNAQLDNEKSSLQYQVDTLRDVLLELEEELAESRRQYDEKHKECERQKHDQSVLRFQLAEMKDALEQREALLTKNGIALDSGVTPNGDASLEPHVNADGPPSPPIRSTSMGKSETEVEKKENMSVLVKCSPSGTDQDRQEVLQDAPVETPLHSEGGNATEEHSGKDINGNTSGELEPADDCNYLSNKTNFDQPELVLKYGTGQVDDDKEVLVQDDHKSVEEEVLEHTVSEVDEEANQKDVIPSESEVFQDALEFVAQSPNEVSGLTEEVSFCASEGHKSSQAEDLNRKDEECKVQHTLDENNTYLEERVQVMDSETHDTNEIPNSHSKNQENEFVKSPHCDHNVSCSTQESCENDTEEKTNNKTARDGLENMKSCGKIAQLDHESPKDESPKDESGVQSIKENLDQKENDEETGSDTVEKLSLSVEQGTEDGRQDVDQNKDCPAPEHPLKDAIVTDVEVPFVDSENIKIIDDSESCILNKIKSISEDEAVNLNVVEREKNKEQQELSTESCTVANSLNPSPERSQENDNPQCGFLESSDAKIMDQEEQNTFSDEIPQEIDDSMPKVSENTKDFVPSETLSSEGESTQDGDETDDEEDGAIRSEKYTGESEIPCAPAGSTGCGPSLEDIRMEDSLDTCPKKGKGKNKEDCALS